MFPGFSGASITSINGVFDFNCVEEVISRPGNIGRRLILRLYCDWYGEDKSSDGPEWLYSKMGVARLQNDKGKYVTDFNDINFINESIQAIEKLINYFTQV